MGILKIGQSRTIGTGIILVGNTITISVRTTTDRTRDLWAFIPVVRDSVSIAISYYRTSFINRQSRFIRAFVLRVDHAIIIPVRTTSGCGQSGFFRTLILVVCDPIPIRIGASIICCRAGDLRTEIQAVRNPVIIHIRTTMGFQRTCDFRALIFRVGDAIQIRIRATLQLQQSRQGGTTIILVQDAIPVRVDRKFDLLQTWHVEKANAVLDIVLSTGHGFPEFTLKAEVDIPGQPKIQSGSQRELDIGFGIILQHQSSTCKKVGRDKPVRVEKRTLEEADPDW